MASFINRYPTNVPGRYYVDGDCTDCDLCRETAPHAFRRDDEAGISYVYQQPTTAEEIALCEESREGCPTEAIGCDGEQFNWATSPLRDWSRHYEHLRANLAGRYVLSPEQEAQLPRVWSLPAPKMQKA